jgi:two-component system OmpR family sensor kinase
MFRLVSLRTRLVLGVLALAAVALVAADFATSRALRSFLIQRTDSSLEAAHQEVEAAINGRQPPPPTGTTNPQPGQAQPPPVFFGSLLRTLPGLFIETRTPAGKVVFKGQEPQFFRTGKRAPPPRLPKTFELAPPEAGGPDRVAYLTVPATSGGGSYRVRASRDPGASTVLIIATSLDGVTGTLHRLFLIELVVTAAGLAGILLLSLWVVRLALRPLDAISATAAAIGSGDLGKRVDRAEERTEVGRLGLALNAMLGQIESAFNARRASEDALRRSEARMRRFIADASHELRNPIAATRAYAELLPEAARRGSEDRERAIDGIRREADRMGVLVDDLLLLAHLDEGRPLAREPVQLDELVFEATELAHTLDPDRPLELDVEQAAVLGDRLRLRQVIDNLLSNARSHTPARASVRISLNGEDGSARLAVADSGPGLDPAVRDRVFERFYRADATRSDDDRGAGLGLSIVAAVVKAHGGEVSVTSTPGQGATFVVTLPLSEPASNGSG